MNETTKEKKPKTGKKKGKKKVVLILVFVLVVLIVGGLFLMPKKAAVSGGSTVYSLAPVERRNITASLSGTGTLAPTDYHNITATVTGDILSADFEEMDEVQKDDVLYVIDSSDLEDDIDDAQKDVDDALKDYNDALDDYNDLKIKSETVGTIYDLYVEEGDTVQNGMQIARIVDSDTMLLKIPFFSDNADKMRVGNAASVTFGDTGEVLTGSVSELSLLTTVGSTGAGIREVTIAVKNPGGITQGREAYASVSASDGNVYTCSDSGKFDYNEDKTVTAKAMGDIDVLYVKEGDRVSVGTLLAACSSETLDKQVEQLKKSYDSQKKRLDKLIDSREDYIIKAPISGTIVQKNYKALDTIGSSSMSSTTTLALIYDMSKLEFDMNIDELDLSQIKVGQSVRVTSDSVTGKEFTGVVTKKSIVGTTSNGTTTYPVTVELDGNDTLLPGMNINAEIITENAENILTVPLTAVDRGNRVKVYKGTETALSDTTTAPEYETVEVETGISDDNYIEIVSGLNEGDVVVVEKTNVAAKSIYDMMYSDDMGDVDNGPSGGGDFNGPPSEGGGQPGGGGGPSGGGGRPGM